jgi:hypothetical protein
MFIGNSQNRQVVIEIARQVVMAFVLTMKMMLISIIIIVKSYAITGLNRPIGLQEAEAPRIYRQSPHEGGKVVSPKYRPSLPPPPTGRFRILIPVKGIGNRTPITIVMWTIMDL